MKLPSLSVCPLFLGLVTCFAGHANADATVTACGKDVWPGDPRIDLSEAMAVGGRIGFACSGTIMFSRSHPVFKDVEIDGGGAVTLHGNGNRMFGMGSGRSPRISFKAIRITGGGVGPSGLPGSVVSGEGDVAFLSGTILSGSQKPVWVMLGGLEIENAWFFENTGPVVIVSEGTLDISKGARFTDNPGRVIATGPSTRTRISDTQFLRSWGADFGGTIAKACDVTIRNSWFADNAVAEDGGAISTRCKLTIEDTRFERNRAGRDGGAIFLGIGGNVTMRAALFEGNIAAANGGAVASFGDLAGTSAVRVHHGRFENNQAGATGGAISAGESGRIEIAGGSFVGNSATNAGGALYVRQSPLEVSRSLFLKNRSKTGGAIESLCMPQSAGRIANSILAGNVAVAAGAFYGTDMTFINATIVSNGGRPVQQGARCSGTSAIAFANTIIEGGFSGGCSGADSNHIFKDLGHNLQFPGRSCGPTIASGFPLLGRYFAPFRPFSPAGGAGSTAVCMAPPVDGRDIFGAHRPQGSTCSIGAVEGDLSDAAGRVAKRKQGDLPRR